MRETRPYCLDLGCSGGSFAADEFAGVTIRLDLDLHPEFRGCFIQADAARLPFRSRSFERVISNHSLEHFADPAEALREVGRILGERGSLLVTVPDANSLTDRIYRWLARGGGHVNQFGSAEEVAELIGRQSGLRHVATQTLCTSLSFLNRRNTTPPRPKRLAFLCWGFEKPLVLLNALFRIADRMLGTRLSVYGWAFYFGDFPAPVSTRPWTNVCVRCGRGHPSDWLDSIGALRHSSGLFRILPCYRCPTCRTSNFYTRDEDLAHLI